MERQLGEIRELIKGWKQVVLVPHVRPDADALGACLALMHYFTKRKIKARVIAPTYYPFFLHWFPGNERVWQFFRYQPQTTSLVKESDAVFCLDFNDLDRIDHMGQIIGNHAKMIVNIDHHLEPKKFATLQYVNPKASSTCELIYEFIAMLDGDEAINKNIATCLYAGIFMDTGGFRHSNTTAHTHAVSAKLMEKGIDIGGIHSRLLDSGSVNRLRFIGHSLLNRMKVYPMEKTALITISKADFEEYALEAGDTEGLVNLPLSIKEVNLAVMMKEEDDIIKMSFRSKNGFEVNEFARAHFNGGGHAQAAGGRSDESLKKTIKKFERLIKDHRAEITA